ncbi:hypothetical protein DPMN_069940 [Dreissena polymorpha]|uniref:Uncharacterized protein n=1 Tax=Dreissena polymorpha TaxID=45954 RepID=A0A9D3Z0G1_DREPO|nr:hypothetical protein DPMN_069940 [Dreissena polymorpha]
MILRFFLSRSHYFPVPPRLKPVNSPAESRSTPDWFIPVKAGSVPAEPRYTVTTPALNGAIPASDTGRASATPRFNRGQPELHRESIKMLNTSGMNRESPVRTGNDRLGTGTTGTAPGTTGTAPSKRRFTYVP